MPARPVRCACGAISIIMTSVALGDPSAAGAGAQAQVRLGPSHAPSSGSALWPAPPTPPQNLTSPLTFYFTPVGNLEVMQFGSPAEQALAAKVLNGFVAAGDRWRAIFADPVTVNIDVDFAPIGNGVLGGANSSLTVHSYSNVRTQMGLDAKSAEDTAALGSLQPGASMQFVTNDVGLNVAPGTSPRVRDADVAGAAANNNNFLALGRANAKALGISLTAGSDANITFTDFSDYAPPKPAPPDIGWDFDPSDGIAANRVDFVGVATHEIAHAMGFFSGVDSVDRYGSPNGPGRLAANGGPLDINPYAVFNSLDLFRFSEESLDETDQPAGGLRDLAFAQFDAASRPFFSIDSGETNLAPFSTGFYNGDGWQAGHWQDGLGMGIMDPTFSRGELGAISALDIEALDVVGWDPLPEPSSAALFVAAFAIVLGRFKRPGRQSN
jgi:hypothetical protein